MTQQPDSLRYLLLRTELSLKEHARLITPIVRMLPYRLAVLRPGGGDLLWKNGIVIRFRTQESPQELGDVLSAGLAKIETWAIHDGFESVCEAYGGGLVLKCFRDTSNLGLAMTQSFVRYRDDERDSESLSDRIRIALGHEARRVFHFSNGGIFMTRTSDPANITARRLESVHNRIHSAVVSDGETTRGCPDTLREDCWRELFSG